MGAFVLGVLVGWLAEWMFYTFWVKAGDGDDCSKIKAELELKNRQISSLQSQLASATEGTQSKSDSSDNFQSAVSNTSHASTTSSASANKQSAAKPSNAKESGKTTSKSPAKAKTSNVATKTTNKATVNKTQVKAKASGDDFTKLTGIGPSMSATLKSLGIDTFEKLAATDDDNLRDMLEASGARMNNNKEAMDSWNEQATVAATGDFKALKAMQAALKS